MSKEDFDLPEIGELVISTITRITPYGAYARLDEYDKFDGLLHISEVSSGWVKNIRNHIREGQKTVLKVLRVDAPKLHVDLSLRRVNEREKKERILEWKQDNRGKKLLGLVAEKMQVTPEEAYETIGKIIETSFDNIYLGLEKAVENGDSVLTKCGVPSDWAKLLVETAQLKIKIPRIRIRGTLELKSVKPNGVTILKNVFAKARNIKKPQGSTIKIFTAGSPSYRVEITAENYKEAESIMEKVSQTALRAIKAEGGEGKFTRRHA